MSYVPLLARPAEDQQPVDPPPDELQPGQTIYDSYADMGNGPVPDQTSTSLPPEEGPAANEAAPVDAPVAEPEVSQPAPTSDSYVPLLARPAEAQPAAAEPATTYPGDTPEARRAAYEVDHPPEDAQIIASGSSPDITDSTATILSADQTRAAAPLLANPDAPVAEPPGALQQATDALGQLIAPVTEALPEPVQNFTDIVGQPVGGIVQGAQDVGAQLLEGDIPGAIGAGLATASGPYTRVIEETGNRIASGQSATPTPDEILSNPGAALAELGGTMSRYGPAPAVAGLMGNPNPTEEDWWSTLSAADQDALRARGPQAMHQAWMTAIGSTDVPPPQLSNPFDAATAANPLERAGQVLGAVPQFAGGWMASLQQGTLGPFVTGQLQGIAEDPLFWLDRAGIRPGEFVQSRTLNAAKQIPGVGSTIARLTGYTPEEQARLAAEEAASATGEHLQSLQSGIAPGEGLPTDRVPTPDEVGPGQVVLQQTARGEGTSWEAVRDGEHIASAKTPEELAAEYPDLVDPSGRIDPTTMDRMRATVVDRRVLDRQLHPPSTVGPDFSVSPISGVRQGTPTEHPLALPLARQLAARGLGDYTVSVVNKLSDVLSPELMRSMDGFEPLAVHDSERKLITISLDHARKVDHSDLGISPSEALRITTSAVLDHEVVHALRHLDLFSEDEWHTLVGAALENNIRSTMVDRATGELLPPYKKLIGEAYQEELVAHLYQAYREGTLLADTPAASLMGRLREFLVSLGNALRNSYPKDVLQRIDSGEIGSRPRGVGRPTIEEAPFSAGAVADGATKKPLSFAARSPSTEPDEMRAHFRAEGVDFGERDPTLIDRFRNAINGRTDQEIVQMFTRPFMDWSAPHLDDLMARLDPDWRDPELRPGMTAEDITAARRAHGLELWDNESAARMERSIAFAKRLYDTPGKPSVVDRAINTARVGNATVRGNPDALKPPSARTYDLMLRLPMGHLLWYDLSGYIFDKIDLPAPRDTRDLIDLVAATSGGEGPYNNARLAMALYGERETGGGGWVGLRDETGAENIFQGMGHPGPKFNNFARNISGQSRIVRDSTPDPTMLDALPTIDMWQYRAYNVPPDLGTNALFAIIAHHTIAEGDRLQELLGHTFAPIGGERIKMEHRIMQAGPWVLGRANEGFDLPVMTLPKFEGGTDYWSVINRIKGEMDMELPESGLEYRDLAYRDLTHPAFIQAMTMHGIHNYEDSRHAFMEMATDNTIPGVAMKEMLHNLRQIEPGTTVQLGRANFDVWDSILNGRVVNKVTYKGLAKIQQGAFASLSARGKNSILSRMVQGIIGDDTFGFSRVNQYSLGSWGSVTSPNVDIPLYGRRLEGPGASGGKIIQLDNKAVTQFLSALSQAAYQDGRAWNRWNLSPEAGKANAFILESRTFHLEDATESGRKLRPESLEQLTRLGSTLGEGWATATAASPLATQIRLINTGGDPLTRTQVMRAIEASGFAQPGEFHLKEAQHESDFISAHPEFGYAAEFDLGARRIVSRGVPADGEDAGIRGISDPVRAPSEVLYNSRLVGPDGSGRLRERFDQALTEARDVFDAANAEIGRSVAGLRPVLEAALQQQGLSWDTPPELADRRLSLEGVGGTARNFPIGQELRDQVRNQSLQFAARAAYGATDPVFQGLSDAAMSDDPHFYHGVHNSAEATRLLMQDATGQLVFRDGHKPVGMTFGEVAEQTLGDITSWTQGMDANGVPLDWTNGRTAAAREWKTYERRFNPNGDVDTKSLVGPNAGDARVQHATGVLTDALGEAVPEAKRTAVGGAFANYTNAIRQAMLFNVLNVPRYMMQNLVGNTVNVMVRGGGIRPALETWTNLHEWSRVYGNMRDMSPTTLNALEKRTGQTRPNIQMTQRNYFNRIGGDTPSWLNKGLGLVAPEATRFLASVPDQLVRENVGNHAVFEGYHALNARLLPNLMQALKDQGITDLPRTSKAQKVIGQFLADHRNLDDAASGAPIKTLTGRTAKFEATWHPDVLKTYLRDHLFEDMAHPPDSGQINRALYHFTSGTKDAVRQIWDDANTRVDHTLFSWRNTVGDEYMGKATLFHYYTSRQGGFYISEALKHPWVAGAYGRAMAEMEAQNKELGGPAWLTGFFQFANSVAGFTTFWSPFDWAHTALTMADWQADSGDEAWKDLTPLGSGFSAIPFFIHPAIQMVAYDLGLLGPDYRPPPLTGAETFVSKAIDLLNLANGQGAGFMKVFNAMGVGVDAHGNRVAIPPRPMQDLYGRVGHVISAALGPFTGLDPVEDSPSSANITRNVQTIGEQDVRITHPHWDSHRVMSYVNDILADPGNSEYQNWYGKAATIPFQLGPGVPLPVSALARIASPFGITTMPEQRMLDTMEGAQPSGALPPRDLPKDPELRKDVENEAKYGASKTLEGRKLTQQQIDYQSLNPPDLLDARYTASQISGSKLPDGQIVVGGTTYTNEYLATLSGTARRNVREAYLQEMGYTEEDLTASYDAESEYLAEHPDYAQFKEWKKLAGQYEEAAGDPGVQRFVEETAAVNPGFDQYLRSEMTDHQTGEINYGLVFTPDAYLASQGIRPSVYSPTTGLEPSRAPGGYPGVPGVSSDQPILPQVKVMGETPIFHSPGDASGGYFAKPPLTVVDPNYGGQIQVLDTRTDANAGLPVEKQLVLVSAGGVVGFAPSSMLTNASPNRPVPAGAPAGVGGLAGAAPPNGGGGLSDIAGGLGAGIQAVGTALGGAGNPIDAIGSVMGSVGGAIGGGLNAILGRSAASPEARYYGPQQSGIDPRKMTTDYTGQTLVSLAQSFMHDAQGPDYRHNFPDAPTDDPWKTGWDCSSFIHYLADEAGISEQQYPNDPGYKGGGVPVGSHFQWQWATENNLVVGTSWRDAQPGDAIYWETDPNRSWCDPANYNGCMNNDASHVSLYLGPEPGTGRPLMMHAAAPGIGTVYDYVDTYPYPALGVVRWLPNGQAGVTPAS